MCGGAAALRLCYFAIWKAAYLMTRSFSFELETFTLVLKGYVSENFGFGVHLGIIKHFDIFKMATKMLAMYTLFIFCHGYSFKIYSFALYVAV